MARPFPPAEPPLAAPDPIRRPGAPAPTPGEETARSPIPGVATATDAPGELPRTVVQDVVPVAGAAQALIAPDEPPEAVEGYELGAEIGRGGAGVVYKARHVRLNRPAAIKMLLGGRYADPAARARFLVEAEAVAQLQHPHVVQVYEFGQHRGQPFFALEFVPGGTLGAKITRDGRFAPGPAAALVAKLADAVAAAHQKGIVHRDLNPANVLLTADGEPKVADFGLARIGQSGVTALGAVLGTPSYMSPEQAAGKTHEVGTPTDVYSLGAILYELLTGRPPFRGDSASDTVQQVLTREPDRPRALTPGTPRDLETICVKCLEKEPRKRYPTAQALGDDLLAFLDGRPITARPVGPVERAVKWARRNPARSAALVAWVLILAAAALTAREVSRQRAADRAAADRRQADEVARKERVARAGALVEALAGTDTAAVPRLAADLAPFRDLTGPKLRELAAQPIATKAGLHARLALLADEPALAAELAAYLPVCRPGELLPIRGMLRPHAGVVAPLLWPVLTDQKATLGRRVRAACALAGLMPDDPRWAAVVPAVAVVRASPVEFVVWADALEPVRGVLIEPLLDRYRAAQSRIRSGRLEPGELVSEAAILDLAANLLARYTADRPDDLAELAMTVDARHHSLLAPALAANREEVVLHLRTVLTLCAVEIPELPDQAARHANAAATLLMLHELEIPWGMLRFGGWGDPTARSYLVARLAAIGADPAVLIRQFGTESDVSARRALALALGDYPPSAVPAAEREPFVGRLLTLYRDDPDPGLHSAIDWLLRRWGKAADVARIDAELATRARARPLAGVVGFAAGPLFVPDGTRKDWFVSGEGQTFAVVRKPGEFRMGSPSGEPGRSATNEPAHRKHIGRAFAVGTREVTLGEFRRFRADHPSADRDAADRPAAAVTWYEAAAYCNWLSEREGVPRDQWCYEPNRDGKYADGMAIRPGHLALTGYRLPTEAEWEYACRGGSVVSRPFGRADELLPRYGWFLPNAEDGPQPVGRLRPNDLGLFDVLGNVLEWVEDPAALYDTTRRDDADNTEPRVVKEQTNRIVRGGSFLGTPGFVRSAYRNNVWPSNRGETVGFRLARTVAE